MSPEQFDRWLDFAERMARTCHKHNARVRRHVQTFIGQYENCLDRVTDWDGNGQAGDQREWAIVTDDMSNYLFECGFEKDGPNGEHIETLTGNAIECCVRAGLDMASKPSAGVVGYTVGDLRRMYSDGLPTWLVAIFGARKLKKAKSDAVVWL